MDSKWYINLWHWYRKHLKSLIFAKIIQIWFFVSLAS